jgi:hypothetical protein
VFDGFYICYYRSEEFSKHPTLKTMKTTAQIKQTLTAILAFLIAGIFATEASAQQYVTYNTAQAQQIAAYQQQVATYNYKMAVYQQQMAVYQQQKAAYDHAMARQSAAARPAPAAAHASSIRFDGRYAATPSNFPAQVQYAVNAANRIQSAPYRRGGGHARVDDNAYDCSGSVSHVLIKAGLLRAPLPSSGFANYGLPGPGRYITIFVKPGEHVFMTVCGLRMDTGGGRQEEGPRWRAKPRSTAGFSMRHPAGF